ncbi:hypothetical protein GN278_17680 [Rhodobacteraceae bacterium Araon29]
MSLFPTRRSPLFVIAGFLLVSAALRVGLYTGEAIAANPDINTNDDPETQILSSANCQTDNSIEEMILAIQEKSQSLRQKEASIASQKLALTLSHQAVDQKLTELKQAEDNLLQAIAISQTAAKSDIENLTSVYASMKPKQASRLFEEMDSEFASGFLGLMPPESAAEIMAGLSPQKAYAISILLAGRNANAPTD